MLFTVDQPMEDTLHTKAIILHRRPFKENDLLVSVYSKDLGILHLVARGALKPGSKLAGHVEPLVAADIMVIKGKGRNYIGSSIGRSFYTHIKNDLNRLSYAGSALRLVEKETKEGENTGASHVFDLLNRHLDVLETGEKDCELLNFSFFLKFSSLLGSEPQLFNCCNCGNIISSGRNFFSSREGGVMCSECGKGNRRGSFLVSDDCIKVLRFLGNNDPSRISSLRVEDKKLRREIAGVIKDFYEYNFK